MKPRPSFVAKDFAGQCKIFPEHDRMLLPYQRRWVTDNARMKLCEKSRQIGLSWTTAYSVIRRKLAKGARLRHDNLKLRGCSFQCGCLAISQHASFGRPRIPPEPFSGALCVATAPSESGRKKSLSPGAIT
jgi:hypothetical protein